MALAYKNFLWLSSICSFSSASVVEISPSIIGISMVHAFCNSFSSSQLVGPCTVFVSLLITFSWSVSFIALLLWLMLCTFSLGTSLFSHLHFLSNDTLSCVHRATLYLTFFSSLLSVFINSPYISSSYFIELIPWSPYTTMSSSSLSLYMSVHTITHYSHTLLSPKSIISVSFLFCSFS